VELASSPHANSIVSERLQQGGQGPKMGRSAKVEEGGGNNSSSLGASLISEMTVYIAFHFIEIIFFGLFRCLLSIFFLFGVKRKYTEINYMN
jgi:hypothetical protein